MEIIPYAPALSADLASAYNRAIRGVPHCYPASAEAFGEAVAPALGEGGERGRLHSEAAFVANDGAALRGFLHVALERSEKEGEAEQGIIYFFWHERGHRAAGQALLDAAHGYLREREIGCVTAFWQDYRYPFYHLEHAYLSDRLDHVAALLGLNGYRKCAGEVYLDWPDYRPGEPAPADLAVDIALEWLEGRGSRPGLVAKAHHGGREVGWCRSLCAGDWSRADAAQDWFLTVWLGIEDAFLGRGLGRHLLGFARRELHAVGYRHAAISTSWDNWRAFVFYSNDGYRVADWTYGWRRDLGDG